MEDDRSQVWFLRVNPSAEKSQCSNSGNESELCVNRNANDPFVAFARFLSIPPWLSTKEDRSAWVRTLYCNVALCATACSNPCPARQPDHQCEIVCKMDYDSQVWSESDGKLIDLMSLPVDQVCCYSLPDSDDLNLEFVCPVEKRIMRSDGPEDLKWARNLDPRRDKVIIISYAEPNARDEGMVQEEAKTIIFKLAQADFWDSPTDLACNSPELMEDILQRGIDDVKRIDPSPAKRKQTLKKVAVIWVHNALPAQLESIFVDLPVENDLIIHLIGSATDRALEIPFRIKRLTAAWFLTKPRWGERRIKLLFLSLSHKPRQSEQTDAFIRAYAGGFAYELLKESPTLAGMVCLRWCLKREIVQSLSEAFYESYLADLADNPGSLLNSSRALFEARQVAYDRWKKGETDYYCAWAAPMLITQEKRV